VCQHNDFDVIVIGSGAGGAAFAHACALSGKRVLVVERGRTPASPVAHDERATLIDKGPYDDRAVVVNGASLRLFMGGVLGGGTSVFGGAMLRPSAADFHPGRSYGDRLTRELWDWPIAYEDLSAYYDQAESLYRVAAAPHDDYSPLNSPCRTTAALPLELAPVNVRLVSTARRAGLRPFQLPLAIDSERCLRCSTCTGFLCVNGARRSAAQILNELAAIDRCRVLPDTEVERLEFVRGGRVDSVLLRRRSDGSTRRVGARCFALAAGAVGSPAILLRSGCDGPHIGRNYMLHYSPIVVGLFGSTTGADHRFVKQVGFADYYFGTAECPQKMGLIQSLPAPGPLMLAKSGLKRWPQAALAFLRRRMLPLTGIVEDLPDPANRVDLANNGSLRLSHRFSAYDRERGRSLARAMQQILRGAGALACVSRAFPSAEHVAHQCGTLRMGALAKHAVVDRDCRLFGSPNLFVVDGSVLPTSLGVGPSLTIVANALRVARAALTSI
jgi:choline dehydrogenase-like flavoprotein